MGIRRERIDIEMEYAIYAYLNRDEHSTDPEKHAAWAIRNKKVLAFRNKYRSRSRSRNDMDLDTGVIKARYISYDMLPEVLKIAEVSGKQLFEDICGIPVNWPSDLQRELAEACAAIPAQKLEKICIGAMALTSDWWHTPEKLADPPSEKALSYLRRQTLRSTESFPDWLQRAWVDRHRTTGIETKHLPLLSERIGVSMHWLTNLPEDVSFYGTEPKIDRILDAVSFMSEPTQQLFLNTVKQMEG